MVQFEGWKIFKSKILKHGRLKIKMKVAQLTTAQKAQNRRNAELKRRKFPKSFYNRAHVGEIHVTFPFENPSHFKAFLMMDHGPNKRFEHEIKRDRELVYASMIVKGCDRRRIKIASFGLPEIMGYFCDWIRNNKKSYVIFFASVNDFYQLMSVRDDILEAMKDVPLPPEPPKPINEQLIL